MRLTRAHLLTPLIVCALSLSGCGSDAPAVRAAAAGLCVATDVADGKDLAPDLSTVVSCAEPHGWEIVGVARVPREFRATGSRAHRLAVRKELANVDAKTRTARAKRFWSRGFAACGRVVAAYLRPATFALAGGPAKGMELQPYVTDTSVGWVNATSPERWVAGDQRYVCSVRYDSDDAKAGADGKLVPIASAGSEPAIRGLFGSSFPAGRRACGLTRPDSDMLTFRSCNTRHNVEHLWLFTPSGALAHADEDALRKACSTTYERFGHPLPKGASIAVSFVTKRSYRTCVMILAKSATTWTAFS